MEKQIKAKAIALDNLSCDWVKGQYWWDDNNQNHCIGGPQIVTKHYIHSFFPGDWGMGGWENVPIDPETILLKVMNLPCGFEFYEGDSFEFLGHKYTVLWNEYTLAFEYVYLGTERANILPPFERTIREVIKGFHSEGSIKWLSCKNKDLLDKILFIQKNKPNVSPELFYLSSVRYDETSNEWLGILKRDHSEVKITDTMVLR